MGVNNLPIVVAWQCTGQESNPGSLDLESDTLTTMPPKNLNNKTICLKNLIDSPVNLFM